MHINLTTIKVSLGNGIVQVKRPVEMAFLQAVVLGPTSSSFHPQAPEGQTMVEDTSQLIF